jgi:hypothetical protein
MFGLLTLKPGINSPTVDIFCCDLLTFADAGLLPRIFNHTLSGMYPTPGCP